MAAVLLPDTSSRDLFSPPPSPPPLLLLLPLEVASAGLREHTLYQPLLQPSNKCSSPFSSPAECIITWFVSTNPDRTGQQTDNMDDLGDFCCHLPKHLWLCDNHCLLSVSEDVAISILFPQVEMTIIITTTTAKKKNNKNKNNVLRAGQNSFHPPDALTRHSADVNTHTHS